MKRSYTLHSDDVKATAFNSLSAMFGSPEIAGKVLAPFTAKNMQTMDYALGGTGNDSIPVGIKEAVQDFEENSDAVFTANRVHAEKLENGNYAIKHSFAEQRKDGSYTHRMLMCTVSDLHKKIPTYTMNDVDVTYNVVPSIANS